MREVVAEAAGGPILLLGVGGKMGPSLAALLIRAGAKHVVGVSRFSDPAERAYLDGLGVETIAADLLAEGALASLPDAPAVFFLAGFKFGASTEENSGMTWAMNALLPAEVVRRYSTSRIVYVSSGNVYPFTPVTGAGAAESDGVGPVGEYAQSRLGGERLAMHVAAQHSTPLCVVRLFYATECRYGIIQDLAQMVLEGEPIPLAMGHVNQIWQGDANAMIARCLPLCAHPARVRTTVVRTTSLAGTCVALLACSEISGRIFARTGAECHGQGRPLGALAVRIARRVAGQAAGVRGDGGADRAAGRRERDDTYSRRAGGERRADRGVGRGVGAGGGQEPGQADQV